MQQPNIVVHYGGILIAVAAAFFFGFLWYGPLFGKTWAKLMGLTMDKKMSAKKMAKPMLINVVGLVLTSYVLAHALQVWRPSVWGVGQDDANYMYGFCAGFFTWIGYYVPMQLNRVAWEKRNWKLFALNSTHDFLKLQIISQILAHCC